MEEKYSYSKLETYDKCPYKFKLIYRDKKRFDATSVAIEYGKLCHKIFELEAQELKEDGKIDYTELIDFFQNANIAKQNDFDRDGDIFGTNILKEKFAVDWYAEDKTGRNYEEKSDEFIKSGIYRLEQYLNEHPTYKLVGVEVPFEYRYRGYIFSGFIDRLLLDTATDEYIIHDIKTSSQAYSDKDCTSPLQMYIYACSLKDKFGDECQVKCFYEFPIAQEMKQGGTPGWEKRCQKKLDKLLDGIESQEWKPKPSPLCYWCQYCNKNPNQPTGARNLCPYYSLSTPDCKSFATLLPWLGIEMDEIQKKRAINLDQLDDDFDI